MDETVDKQARGYFTNYTNGNRNSTCREILTGPNPAVMASRVILLLYKEAVSPALAISVTNEFIRILDYENLLDNCS